MALFSRRVVQSLVGEAAPLFLAGDLRALLKRLNSGRSTVVEAEYELAVLVGLKRLGCVTHAPKQFGRKRPDVYFSCAAGQFLADITCVSQASLTSRGPMRFLQDAFLQRISDGGMAGRNFHLQVGHTYKDFGGPRQVKLSIPAESDVTRLLDKHVPLLIEALKGKTTRMQHHINESGLDVVFTFDPASRYFGAGYLSDDSPALPIANPIFDALKRKAEQLAECGYEGPKAIFLCDSGAPVLREGHLAGPVKLMDIVKAIFATYPWIAFVVTLGAPQGGGALRGTFWHPPAGPSRIADGLRDLVMSLPANLPEAERDGQNAQNWIQAYPNVGASFRGGMRMSSNRITISARALQELLAGRINQEDWLKSHGFIPDGARPPLVNPFESALSAGRLISRVSIEPQPSKDDDWVTFDFGPADPAVSPITNPAK